MSNGERSQLTRKLLLCLLILVAMASALLFLYHAYSVATFPYEMTSGEGLILRDAAYLRTGQPLYTDPNNFPFILSVYPPVFPVLVAPLGITFLASRSIAIMAVLLTCCMIGIAVYNITHRLIPAIASGMAYTGSLFVYQWGVFGRVDTVAVCFSIAAITVLITPIRTVPSTRRLLLSVILCLLAIYTKQSAIAAPAAIFVYLILNSRQAAFRFALILVILGGGIFLIAILLTSGQFYQQLIRDNLQPYSLQALGGYLRAFSVTHPMLLFAVFCTLLLCIRRRNWFSLLPIYLIISGLTILSVGRAGASISYFLEFIAAAFIAFGVLISEPYPFGDALTVALIGGLLWSFIFPHSPLAFMYEASPAFGYNPTSADRAACQQLDAYVMGTSGDILAEEPGIVVIHGRPAIGAAWLLRALHGQGIIDNGYDRLKTLVSTQYFPLVMLHWQSYPEDFLYNVVAHYRKVGDVQCIYHWQIYQP